VIAATDMPSWTRLSPLVERDREALGALVSRLRSGDASVLERVVEELVEPVERWVRRRLGPRSDVDDVVQEALTEIATALHRFEGRSSIQTLAHRITSRTASRFYRRTRSDHDHEIDGIADGAAGPEEDAASRQQVARLYRHIEALSEVRREAFVLCCLDGMEPAEAAEVAQCSAVTMRSRLFEARAELQARFTQEDARAARRSGR
jgi:RNA polymerase sigma-70 factor (ECF subfamily)